MTDIFLRFCCDMVMEVKCVKSKIQEQAIFLGSHEQQHNYDASAFALKLVNYVEYFEFLRLHNN